MRLGRHIALLAIIFFHGTGLFSQIPEETYYFPVRPGEKNYLSGTMGEIRSTHFHTGIDIKTSGISGLRVYATRQGYISRIRVGASGYGNCLYISHPGGEVSVYGHLSEFREDIRKYVISEQYKRQTFEINLYPKPGKFPIDKGELIAFSGNSGSSSGPHLHFEIRDSLQNVLNPLQMKFGEIRDDIPPIVQSFSIRPLDIQARVKGQFENVIFTPERVNMEFLVNNPIEVYGLIGIQLQAHDKLSGAANKNGIPFLRMYFDDKIIFDARITRFNFNDAAHTPIYYDNALKMRTGRTFQKLYIDDGNNLPFYDLSGGNGKIYIGDTLEHSVEIVLSDLAGNKSVLSFRLKGALPAISVEDQAKPVRESLSCDIIDNALIIFAEGAPERGGKAFISLERRIFELIPSYSSTEADIYLWDLRHGIPKSIKSGNDSINPDICISIPPKVDFTYYDPFFEFKASKGSLFDTLYLTRSYQFDGHGEIFQVGSHENALSGEVRILFNSRLTFEEPDKYGVYYIEKSGKLIFAGNTWQGGLIGIMTNTLGNFTILKDTVPPEIIPVRVNNEIASFRIRDRLSGIKKYEAILAGKWLLMNYDEKKDHIWSVRQDEKIPLQGELVVSVTDQSGNKSELRINID